MVKFKPDFERRYPYLERVIAIVALINLGLVFFDLSYLSLRPIYKQNFPVLTQIYDPVKGIESRSETEEYQAQVDNLEAQLGQHDLESAEIEASLSDLRTLSQRLITSGAFVAPNGEHALATVQQNLQARTGQPFAQDAFDQFWSIAYLEQRGWQSELAFWDAEMRPFFEANYYRRVNQWGRRVDNFWLIDLPFMLIFATDVVMRLIAIRHRNRELTWLNIALRRWYDIFLLLPFLRWLRVIPVTLRLYQVDFLNLEPVKAEVQRDIVVTVGADLAGIVGIEIIEQMQDSVRQGDVLDWLLSVTLPDEEAGPSKKVVAQQEIFAIATHLYDVSVHHVLPRVQNDVEDLVQHSLTKTLEQMPGYLQLNHVPGLGKVSSQVVQQLSNSVVQGIYQSMSGALSDPQGQAITDRLQHNFREAVLEEFDQHNTPEVIQSRLVVALEKFKAKYIRALVETGGEKLAERTELLHKKIS